jgi:hypothetical protein
MFINSVIFWLKEHELEFWTLTLDLFAAWVYALIFAQAIGLI